MGVRDFWVWSTGELRDSAARGVVPEFFVARAVCAEAPQRLGWTNYDVETPAGVRSE